MNGADVERARAALGAIDSSIPRAVWLAVAMAAKSAGLELDDFTAWSSTAANFGGERDCASTWRSIKPVGGVTAASLFHRAREAGWRDDAEHRPRPNRPRAGPRIGSSKAKFDWRELWESAEPATVDHPYILRKLGLADGLRVYHGPARIGKQPAMMHVEIAPDRQGAALQGDAMGRGFLEADGLGACERMGRRDDAADR